jgi:hypothetical protein
MSFKFLRGEEEYSLLQLEPTQLLTINRPTFVNVNNVEFCFQFDEEEPVVFATGPNECSIQLSPTSDSNIAFNNNGREFKLFARERVNE